MICHSVGWLEDCCSWSSGGSAEMLVGHSFVCCVGWAVEQQKRQAVALVVNEASPC